MKKTEYGQRLRFDRYTSEIRRYSLLLLLPLALGVVLLFCMHSITSAQIEQRGNATAQHLSSNASSILREMQLVSDSLLKDGQFIQEITAQSSSDPAALCERIYSHLRESPYVSNAYVISERHQHIYTERAYFMYEGIDAILRDMLPSAETDAAGEDALNLTPGWHVLNGNYAPPYYVATISENGTEAATLLVTLNMREFLRSLYATDADMCCVFNDDFSVSTLLKNYPRMNWRSPGEVSRILGREVRCFYIEADEFTYLTAISVREYNAPLKTVLRIFCIYFALVFVVGMIYLMQISKRRYRAVAEMVDGLPHSLSRNPTYEDILSAVRNSLDAYRDKYQEELERARSQQLQYLLTGNQKQTTPQQLAAAGITPEADGYYLCLLFIHGSDTLVTSGSRSQNVDATRMIFQSALVRFSEGTLDVATTLIDTKYYAVFSVPDGKADDEYIRAAVRNTIKFLKEEYGLSTKAAVSERIGRAEQLGRAFVETNGLYNFSKAVGSHADVVLQSDIESKMSVLLNGNYLKQIEILSRTLLMEKYDMVPSMVKVILDEHVAGIGKHYSLAKDRLSDVADLLAEAVMACGIENEETREQARALRSADSVLMLNALTREVFAALMRHPRHSENDTIVDKACAYIRETLSDPNISIPEISQAVGVSVQHLSRLFRQRMDTTLLEYINTCRIELAKQTLAESGCTVSRVAEIAGYNNTVTLSRNFKRYVGLSPSEYRELNKQQNGNGVKV